MMQILDLKGLKCPLPALKTRKALKSLMQGQEITVMTTDPLAIIDIPALLIETGEKLISTTKIADGHHFIIQKS